MGKHNTYATSHLGLMATELLKGISTLQKKYPETEEKNSIEKKHALNQLKTLEIFIRTLHNKLLPQFDNHRAPTRWDMLSMARDVYALYTLKNEFNTRRYTLYLAIQKELPAIVKQAQRQFQEPQAIANAITKTLDEKTKSLFEIAALIPGDSFDVIMGSIKHAITNINEHNINLKEANCAPKLEAMLAQKLFKNNKVTTLSTKVKSESEKKVDAIFEFEQGKTNLVIAHPMIFEFAELLVRLKENTPNELAELIPFFNPEAFNVDFHSGALGTIVCELFGATYLLKNEPRIETNEPSLVYQFITYSKESKTETKVTIDGSARYPILSEQYQKSLFIQIQQYLTDYKTTAHVQSLHARTKLLSGLTTKESEAITVAMKNHFDKSQSQLNLSTLDSVAAIYAIKKEIEHNQLVLKNNLLLQKSLQERAESYSKNSISHLLITYPELAKQLQEYKLNGINTEFCEQPLPDLIIGTFDENTNTISIIQLQKQLQQLITEQLNLLHQNHSVLQEKITQQQEQHQGLITVWQHATTHTYAETLSTLKLCNDSLEQIKAENKEYTATNDNIETLEQIIARKKLVSLQLEELFHKVTTHLEQIEQSAKLALEFNLDENHLTQNSLITESRPVSKKAQQLLQQIKLVQQEQTKEVQHLEMRLEKSNSEALFAKNMQLADPEKLKQLLLEITQKLKDGQQQQKQLNTELDEIPGKLGTQEKRLTRLNEESIEKRTQKEIIDAEITPMIHSIKDRAEKTKLLTTIPQEKELLENQEQTAQFILNITESINNKLADPLNTLINYQEAHTLLHDVCECLKQGQNKATIPFKTIDGLPIIATMSKGSQFKGFNFFLSFVGLQEELNLFTKYRKSQEDILKISSIINDILKTKKETKQEEYNKVLNRLETAIARTRKDLLKHQDNSCLLEVIAGFKSILPILHTELDGLFKKKIKLISEQRDTQTQHQECSETITKLKEEQAEKSRALAHSAKEQESLQVDQNIIASIITVIENIQNLQQQIQLLANEEHSLYEMTLYQKISQLQQQYSLLKNEVDKIANNAKQSAKEPTYTATLDVLLQLLESTQQQFSTTIKAKVDVSLLQKQYSQYVFDLMNIDHTRTHETEVNSPNELLSRYHTLAVLIMQQDNLIKQFKTNASTINEEHINQNITELELSQEKLHQQSNQLGESLIDDIISTLSKLKTEAQVFEDKAHQESQEKQQTVTSTLERIQRSFATLPKTSEFEDIHLQFANEKLEGIKKLTQEVEEQLSQSQAANQGLLQRIEERKTVVNNLLLPKLDAYCETKIQQHTIKKMLHNDVERFDFIANIKDELANYIVSGDNASVSALIEAHKKRFPGIHFQTILNKITVELFDLSQKVPQNYNQEHPVNIDVIARHQQALEILLSKKAVQSNYVMAIDKLFALINDMAEKWPETKRLTDKLRQDIDCFVISHPSTIPDEKAYNQFTALFTARLHSEDDELSRHRAAWKANFANIMIGVFTLGIALGIKLVHSKWSEGRYSLFFDKTRRQQQIASMEEIVEQSMTSPAA